MNTSDAVVVVKVKVASGAPAPPQLPVAVDAPEVPPVKRPPAPVTGVAPGHEPGTGHAEQPSVRPSTTPLQLSSSPLPQISGGSMHEPITQPAVQVRVLGTEHPAPMYVHAVVAPAQ